MKKLKNKIVAITISMLFILSMTASLMLIPSANRNYFTINRCNMGIRACWT